MIKVKNKRAAILNAALKLFIDKGFNGTPTAKIAQSANVATGTLFHYFSTKEELINTLFLESKEELRNYLKERETTKDTIYNKLYTSWKDYIEWCLHNSDKFRFFRLFSSSPYIHNVTKEEANNHLEFVRIILRSGQKQKLVKNVPIPLLFDTIRGTSQTMAAHFLENPDKFCNQKYCKMAFQIIWDGIKKI